MLLSGPSSKILSRGSGLFNIQHKHLTFRRTFRYSWATHLALKNNRREKPVDWCFS